VDKISAEFLNVDFTTYYEVFYVDIRLNLSFKSYFLKMSFANAHLLRMHLSPLFETVSGNFAPETCACI